MKWKSNSRKQERECDEILDLIREFDKSEAKTLMHVRLDKKTAMLLNQLKLASGVEIQKIISFAVSELIRQHPELKTIVKQFLQKFNE